MTYINKVQLTSTPCRLLKYKIGPIYYKYLIYTIKYATVNFKVSSVTKCPFKRRRISAKRMRAYSWQSLCYNIRKLWNCGVSMFLEWVIKLLKLTIPPALKHALQSGLPRQENDNKGNYVHVLNAMSADTLLLKHNLSTIF